MPAAQRMGFRVTFCDYLYHILRVLTLWSLAAEITTVMYYILVCLSIGVETPER